MEVRTEEWRERDKTKMNNKYKCYLLSTFIQWDLKIKHERCQKSSTHGHVQFF